MIDAESDCAGGRVFDARNAWALYPHRQMRVLVVALFSLTPILIGGCGTHAQVRAPKDDPQFARSIADTATRAAVAKPGARVCREMQVGIAERDWVRGVVVEADGVRVAVRIDEPGRFAHELNGAKLTRGAIVRDHAVAWMPCL